MKKEYQAPEIEISLFETENILNASGEVISPNPDGQGGTSVPGGSNLPSIDF